MAVSRWRAPDPAIAGLQEKTYGYALVFSEVVKLTETEYEERTVSRMEPESFAGGVANHTYNRTERFEVVDRELPSGTAVKR